MPTATGPYETAQAAFNIAVLASNDGTGPNGMEGNQLNPAYNPEVLPAFQSMWVYLQQRLISAGVNTFTKEGVIFNIPPGLNPNARVPVLLTYTGYFNGVFWTGPNVTAALWNDSTTYVQQMTVTYNDIYYIALSNNGTNFNQRPDLSPLFWKPFNNLGPTLPIDLVKPLEIWECQLNNNFWIPMRQAPDSIKSQGFSQQRFGVWMFENDILTMPAIQQATNLKLKYICMAPDIIDFDSPLMVRDSAHALAYLVLYELSGGRGGSINADYKRKAEEAISQIINQTVRQNQYALFQRGGFRNGSRSGNRSGY